ncbi:MAG: hypothetical protein ABIQ74_04145 [Chitinophagales bacterium]
MKKLSSISIIAMFAILTFSSCKKDYSCSCTLSDSLTGTNISSVTTIKDKEDDARSTCEGYSYLDVQTFPGDTINYSCHIQ